MRIWSGIKRRRQEEINSYSLTVANLTANVVSFLRSFGDSKSELPTRDDYLPFHFTDPNSPKAKLKRILSDRTIEIVAKLIKSSSIPPQAEKSLYQVPGLKEVLEEYERN